MNQIEQLKRSLFDIAQIQAIMQQIGPLTVQLAQVNQQLTQLQPSIPKPPAIAIARDFKQELKQEVNQSIQQAIAKSNADLSEAQRKVDQAKADVDRVNQKLESARQAVRNNLANQSPKVKDAQNAFNDAQSALNKAPGWTPNFIIKGLKEALELARKGIGAAFELALKAVDAAQVDRDSTIVNLLKDPAFAVLNQTNQSLNLLKQASMQILQVSNYVAQRGLDALLLINAASFETDLTTATNGFVEMLIQLSYMDRPTTFTGRCNLKDITSLKPLAQAIAKQLLP